MASAGAALAAGPWDRIDRLLTLGFRRRTVSSDARMRGALRRRAGAEARVTFCMATADCFFTTALTAVERRPRWGAAATTAACADLLRLIALLGLARAERWRFAGGGCRRFSIAARLRPICAVTRGDSGSLLLRDPTLWCAADSAALTEPALSGPDSASPADAQEGALSSDSSSDDAAAACRAARMLRSSFRTRGCAAFRNRLHRKRPAEH